MPPIRADRDRLVQILLNILDNAVKFTPAEGTITVAASPGAEGELIVRIADTGVGIPKGEIPRLGERFYRADKTRSRELGGTGLGLSIVKHLMKMHRGRMSIESTPGRGTTVSLHFPLTAGVAVTQKKILVADDEKDIVELIAYNLEREGFAVSRAYDGQKAWEMVNAEKPDLLILDLMMPELPGMEVCARIRRQEATASLPIIMLTAKSDPVDKILGLEIGADDYITKPFHVRELIARVRAVLRRSERLPEADLPEAFDYRGLHIDFQFLPGDDERPADRPELPRIQAPAIFHGASRPGLQPGSAPGPCLGRRGLRRTPDRRRPYQPPQGRDRTRQGRSAVHPDRARHRLQIHRQGTLRQFYPCSDSLRENGQNRQS